GRRHVVDCGNVVHIKCGERLQPLNVGLVWLLQMPELADLTVRRTLHVDVSCSGEGHGCTSSCRNTGMSLQAETFRAFAIWSRGPAFNPRRDPHGADRSRKATAS